MRYFSLFSGIGSFEFGFPDAWACVGYSEIDKYAGSVYRYHYPKHEGYGDATGIDTASIPDFDMLCAGFPCQSFSVAGQRRGMADDRGALFFEIPRILANKKPGYFLLENVKGLLSINAGRTFAEIIRILTDIGYLVQWEVINSKFFGVPQNRERIFIVGHLRTIARPEIFPLGNGNRATDAARDGENSITAGCIGTRGASGQSQFDGSTTVILRLDEDNFQRNRIYSPAGIAPVLGMSDGKGGCRAPLVALTEARTGGAKAIRREMRHNESRDYVPRGDKELAERTDGLMNCVTGGQKEMLVANVGASMNKRRIRRLTPIECERLQGFPDHYTARGIGGEMSDTQRYKMIGNAITTTVISAIANKF